MVSPAGFDQFVFASPGSTPRDAFIRLAVSGSDSSRQASSISDVYCDPATGPTPNIQAGTIPGYAITSKKRVPTLPDLPTSAEAGVAGFDVTTWYGMYAPRNTPKPIVDTLVDALQKALKDPPLVGRFAELSMTPVEEERATPTALEHLLKTEIEK
jgi:tripartite-type tricarboxylate transporter receptor subunit TctC